MLCKFIVILKCNNTVPILAMLGKLKLFQPTNLPLKAFLVKRGLEYIVC